MLISVHIVFRGRHYAFFINNSDLNVQVKTYTILNRMKAKAFIIYNDIP